ncbi:MAG: c-type cytochrome [Deltaproteobacteria bacterium]|nr:c-type cytochrome [Deltaproteobacteria bacterium]
MSFSKCASLVATCIAAALTSACVERTAVERGESLFRTPELSPSPTNTISCRTCHAPAALEAGEILSGGSLANVVGRPTFWGGRVRDLREAVNDCLRFFMRHPSAEGLSMDDEHGLDLLAYLESLGTGPSDAVPFTVPLDVVDIAPGDAVRGRALYDAACLVCHGAPGTGDQRLVQQAAVIPDETIAEHGPELGRAFTISKVRHAQFFGIGGDMPPFSLEVLPDDQLADILAYLGY